MRIVFALLCGLVAALALADAILPLATEHRIAADRLLAQRTWSASPLASNDSEEGRARNRRVERVQQ